VKLYVANPTFQHHQFHYWLPETAGRKQIRIPLGEQRQIGEEMAPAAIDSIIQNYLQYGMMREIDSPPRGRTVCLVYSIDRPVRPDRLKAFADHNLGVQKLIGQKLRHDAAVQTSEQMNQSMQEMNRPERIDTFEMTIQEESDDPTVAEGIQVVADMSRVHTPPDGVTVSRRGRRK